MDLARAQLQKDGEQAYAALFDRIQRFSASLCQTGFSVALPNDGAKDFSRLVLDTTNTGLSGYEVSQKLDSQGIWIEMADSRHLVLICTPQDCARDFARLSNALSQFEKTSSAACAMPTLPVRSEEIFTPAHAVWYNKSDFIVRKQRTNQRRCRLLLSAGHSHCLPGRAHHRCPDFLFGAGLSARRFCLRWSGKRR